MNKYMKCLVGAAVLSCALEASATSYSITGLAGTGSGTMGTVTGGFANTTFLELNTIAGGGTITDTADLAYLRFELSSFCVSTANTAGPEADDPSCVGGLHPYLVSVDSMNVTTNAADEITGGSFSLTAFENVLFNVFFEMTYDFDTGIMLLDATQNGPGWGANTVALDGFPVAAVPVPAAAWLFGSALLGLVGVGRKRSV